VLRWLTFAVFINSTAHPPYGLIQAADRPDLLAKLHVAEVPLYLALLWWMLLTFGIVGVAIAWTIRVVITTVIVFAMARLLLPPVARAVTRIAVITSAASLVLALGTMPIHLIGQGVFFGTVLILFVPAAWFLLGPRERYFVRDYLVATRLLPVQIR
jgi:O-antigen/teichoic acid export membrane protein